MRLDDKVAIITGAASGIGKEIAIVFAQEGAKIVIADLNKEAAEATAAELKATGAQAIGVGVDATSEDQVNASVEEAAKAFGGIDILISNAGIQIVHPVEEFSFADWKKMLAIHLDGAFLTTKACLKHMYAQGRGGSVIYMGSVHSKEASLLKAPYVTAKHGLIGFTKTLSRELGDFGIRVNAILPGAVDGPRLKQVFEGRASATGRSVAQEEAAALANQSIKRFVDPADIAALAVFLASGAARSISGQLIPIDGDSQSAS